MNNVEKLSDIKDQKGFLKYSRDVFHSHSKAAQDLLNLVINHFDIAFEQGRKGRELVWNNTPCPPLIYSCDVTPLTVPDIARFGNAEDIPIAESILQIPSETCAMIKAIAGGFYQFRESPCKRIVVSGLRCEPEMITITNMKTFGYEPNLVDIAKIPPETDLDRAKYIRQQYKEEYQRLAVWLNGQQIDKDKLYHELVRSNRIRKKLVNLEFLEQKHNLYFRTVPVMLARCGVETYFGQPELFENIIDDMIKELSELPENAYHDDNLVKLFWNGARGVDFSVYNAVDITGGYISGWHLPNSIHAEYDLNKDPLDALVDFSLGERGALNIGEICEGDEKAYLSSDARGMILYSTLGCTFGTTGTEMKRRYFTERGIQTLVLTGTAQIGEATGQVITRLKAFVEMLG